MKPSTRKPIQLAATVAILLSACAPAPSPTPTATLRPATTATHAAIITPSPTATPDFPLLLTLTPLPTLSSEEAQAMIQGLLDNNGNCEFPCWWGLTPGQTLFEDAIGFIAPISTKSQIWDIDKRIFSAQIPVPESVNPQGIIYYRTMRENLESANVFSQAVGPYLTPMSEILQSLGEPSEVLFDSPLLFPTDEVSIHLFLFFQIKEFWCCTLGM